MSDAVVIGAGPNGLVAANLLVDHGWDVLVLEAQDEPGGAVRSGPLTSPDFVHDYFSAFYPLGYASPILAALGLDEYGLKWTRAPLALAHPTEDDRCAVLSQDLGETKRSLETYAAGDGIAWERLYELWRRVEEPILDALFTPFPPVAPIAKLIGALGPRDLIPFARLATLSVRRFGEEHFNGAGGKLLLTGNALHTDLSPEDAIGGFFGFLLMGLGQTYGFPVPEGGAGKLTSALVQRLEARGGRLRCGAHVAKVEIRKGRAVGVGLADGSAIDARKAVIADTGAPSLFLDLVGRDHLPQRVLAHIRRFQYDNGTVKVDWAVNGKVPWKMSGPEKAGTVHLSGTLDDLTDMSAQLARRLIPERPFLVMGQMTTADPTRSPEGTESLWAYSHVPQEVLGDAGGNIKGSWDDAEGEAFADRMEDEIERFAPGFRALIGARHVFTPPKLEAANANLVGGALNGGTAQLHQQLVFRPIPGMARPETPIRNLYLASASAHPGGGVHGAPGANAAKAAIRHDQAKKIAIGLGALATAKVLLRRR